MNGKRGVAIDFHWNDIRAKARYTVKLDDGETFKARLDALRPEGLGQRNGGGGGKARGRGT